MKDDSIFALSAKGNRTLFLLATVLWIGIIGGSFLLSWYRAGEAAAELALVEARSSFNKDLIYRRWATIHGGVYVPPADHTPPNPYLDHISDRDVVTISGKRLTLVNPAYMTRQVHELGRETYGTRGHITSLNPIRPENGPDAWETKALKAFHAGTKEFSSFSVMSGQPSLRFMRPLVTEIACLKCHAEQGYRPGDIRGGISVSVPFAPYQQIAGRQQTHIAISHAVIGCLGLLGLGIGRCFVIRSRTALREREEWFRILFEEGPDAVFIETLDDRILDANAAASEMLGYSREEFRAMRVADLQAPEVRGEPGGIIRDELARGDFFEGLDLRKDGTMVPIEVHNRRMRIQGRDLVLSIVRDITERKRAETALRESEEKYRLLFNNADMLISVWDREGGCQLMNRKLADLFGDDPETFVGKSFQDLHLEAAEEYTERIRKAIDSGISRQYEDRVGFPSGDRWLLSQVHPVPDTAGRIQYAQIIAHDISERKAAENALRIANDIIVRSPVAAFMWKNETGWPVEYASANVESIFGWSAEDFLSAKILYLNVIHPEDLERVTHEVAISSADSTQTRVNHRPYRIRRPDGKIRWIEDITVIRRNEGGEVIAYEGILMDITARKQAEAEKARLEAQVR
ncbi:MAG: PAS domain S-box protein, partial [Thermodesulfobacteriota bacterium]